MSRLDGKEKESDSLQVNTKKVELKTAAKQVFDSISVTTVLPTSTMKASSSDEKENPEDTFTQKMPFNPLIKKPYYTCRKHTDFVTFRPPLTAEMLNKEGHRMTQSAVYFLTKIPIFDSEYPSEWVRKTYSAKKDNPDAHTRRALREAFSLLLLHSTDNRLPKAEIYVKDKDTTFLHSEFVDGKHMPDVEGFKETAMDIDKGEIDNYGDIQVKSRWMKQIDLKGSNVLRRYLGHGKCSYLAVIDCDCTFREGYTFEPLDKSKSKLAVSECYNITGEGLSSSPAKPVYAPGTTAKPDFEMYNNFGVRSQGELVNPHYQRLLSESKTVALQHFRGMLHIILYPQEILMNLPGYLTEVESYQKMLYETACSRKIDFYREAKKTQRIISQTGEKMHFADYLHSGQAEKDFEEYSKNIASFEPAVGHNIVREIKYDIQKLKNDFEKLKALFAPLQTKKSDQSDKKDEKVDEKRASDSFNAGVFGRNGGKVNGSSKVSDHIAKLEIHIEHRSDPLPDRKVEVQQKQEVQVVQTKEESQSKEIVRSKEEAQPKNQVKMDDPAPTACTCVIL